MQAEGNNDGDNKILSDNARLRLGDIHPMDTATREPKFLLESYNGPRFKISANAERVLRMAWDGASFSEIAEQLARVGNSNVTCADVERYYASIVASINNASSPSVAGKSPFQLRFTIVPQKLVLALASSLRVAFHPAMAALTVLAIAMYVGIWAHYLNSESAYSEVTPSGVIIGYILYFISLMFHEFGHATACLEYGAKPGPIGFTIYLAFPALYSEVNSAWRLPRWHRVVIDIAGSYFQLMFVVVYVAAYMFTKWPPAIVATFMIIGTTAFNLNPFFKFDGYWVVADALGVPNLGRQPGRLLQLLLQRKSLSELGLPPWLMTVVFVYSLVASVAWAFFIFLMTVAIRSILPYLIAMLREVVVNHATLTINTALAIGEALLTLTLILVAITGIIRRFLDWNARRTRTSSVE